LTAWEAQLADLHVGGQARLSSRTNNAIPYLMAAARYSRLVGQIESENANSEFGSFWEEMRDHATACVFFANAAIESYANELFADATSLFPGQFIAGLGLLWPEIERRKSPIEKLDLALSLRNQPKLDQKSQIVKAIKAVQRLRNELTHFKPEWSHELVKHVSISQDLEGYFDHSPYFRNELIFPRAWITHSCTTWIVQATIAFLKSFEAFADMTNRTKWQVFDSRLQPSFQPRTPPPI
jgi:hypothetical protein